MSEVFLDTSCIIALFNSDDPHHGQASRLLHAATSRGQQLVLTTAILCEAGDGFARRRYWQDAEAFMQSLLNDETTIVISADAGLVQRGLALMHSRGDKRWGLIDCVSFVVMRERGITAALTADRDFVQAGFNALLLDG